MVKAFVAVTDLRWIAFLSTLDNVDEVNFWRPTPTPVRQLAGTPWFLKARAPINAIVGGGFFAHYSDMPLYLAWEMFGEKNGTPQTIDAKSRLGPGSRDEDWLRYSDAAILFCAD